MFSFLKNSFFDCVKIYKNFFHFTLSKILIYIVASFYSLLVFLPFAFVLLGIYLYILHVGELSILWQNLYLLIIAIITFFIWIIFAFSWFSYYLVLLFRLDFQYLKNKKLSFKKNYYFNLKLFLAHNKLFLSILAIVFFPFLIFIFVFLGLVILYWGFREVNWMMSDNIVNWFVITSFIIFVIAFLFFMYFIYKTFFATVILVDKYRKDKVINNTSYYLQKSFKKTKWFKKFLKLFIILTLFIIISLPIEIPMAKFWQTIKEITNYVDYVNNPYDISRNKEYDSYLRQKYFTMTQDQFKFLYMDSYRKYLLFLLLHFLLITWLLEMIIVSFYKREIK